jgi:hypothetical protein
MWKKSIKNKEFSDGNRKVIINFNVFNVFKKFEQNKGLLEAGGILLGYVYKEHDYIIKVTTPNKLDSRGFCFFNRSIVPAQVEINNSWMNSEGTLIYLGEWHTHSEFITMPSKEDVKMIKKVYKETIMEINYLYLVINGLNNAFWVGRLDSEGLVKLEELK